MRVRLLTRAARAPSARSRSIFLEHGADVNVCDEMRWRPLHHAAHFGCRRVLPLLLAAPGVDVNAPSVRRWRPLDVCATAVEARALLEAGAALAAAEPGSLSALHHAAYNGRPDVVQELLARGADVHATVSSEALQAATGLPVAGTVLHVAACRCAVRSRAATTAAATPLCSPRWRPRTRTRPRRPRVA